MGDREYATIMVSKQFQNELNQIIHRIEMCPAGQLNEYLIGRLIGIIYWIGKAQ